MLECERGDSSETKERNHFVEKKKLVIMECNGVPPGQKPARINVYGKKTTEVGRGVGGYYE